MSDASPPRIAVIGSGYWGKNLTRNFHQLGALHTVCDSNADTLAAILEQYPGSTACPTCEEVFANPEIDAVAIATPAETHGALVRQALEAGKDVYVEKPLCLSLDEAKRLIDFAREQSRILMVGHLLWYHPAVLKLKQLIADGELGRIAYIYSNRLNLGKLRREENVLWSFAPHDVSVTLGLLDEEPVRVRAKGGNFLDQRVADTTMSLLDFASGVKAHIFVSWLHPFKEQKLVVVGDKKMAVFSDTLPWNEKLQLYPHTIKWKHNIPVAEKADCEFVSLDEAEPLREECRHFLDCVRQRRTPRTDGREGLRVLRVLDACQKSLEADRGVEVVAADAGERPYYAHETAVIDPQAQIGPGTKIWHFSHVLGNTVIGSGCTLGQNVMVGPNVNIGNNCRIQNNVSIYDGVTLEDDVFCGPSMVFTNVINPRSHISRKTEFLPTRVGHGATIGANATIVCGNHLGRYSFVGAGAVVTHDVADHALVFGNPARQSGWICACGNRLGAQLACPACGKRYRQVTAGLEEMG